MMVKLHFYQVEPDTILAQLRNHLQTLESRIFFLPQRDRPFVLDYLAEMDAAWRLCEILSASGASEVGEVLRFSTLQNQVQTKASAILKILGGPAALKLVRPPDASPVQQPWWFVDREVAQRRAERGKLIARIVGAIAVVVLVIVVLFNSLLKPDPAVIHRIQHYNDALTLATENQDYNDALTEIEQALAVAPDNVELLVFKGVLLAQLNRAAEAEMLFEQATDLAGEVELVLLLRGQLLWRLNRLEAALELAQEAIAINPEYAEAWLLAGQAYTGLGQTPQAYEALSTVADLAQVQDNGPLYVMAKVNLAHLSQGAGLEP